MSDKRNQIEQLKDQFLNQTIDEDVRMSILDTLAGHGNEGINTINELIFDPSIQNTEIRRHGLEIIRRIRES